MIKLQLIFTFFVLFFLAGCNSTYVTPTQTTGDMIIQNKLDALEQHIRSMPDINQANEFGYPLLHQATFFDKIESAELILKLGGDVNVKRTGGITPLFHTNSIPMLNILKKYHVNIHALTDTGLNALSLIDNPSTIEALIKDGLDPTLETADGQSALSVAMTLLKRYDHMYTIIVRASDRKNIHTHAAELKIKIALLHKYASFKSAPEIISLARKGDLAGIQILSKKINIITSTDYVGNTALHIAATNNHLAIVKYLSSNKKLLSIKNKKQLTALDQVIARKSDSAKHLSCKMNKYCKNPKAFSTQLAKSCSSTSTSKSCEKMINKDIHGVFINASLIERANKIRFNDSCRNFSYIKCTRFKQSTLDTTYIQRADDIIQLRSPSIYKKYNTSCAANSKISSCLSFIKTYPGFKPKSETDYALLLLSQKCRTKESGWLYKSSPCKSGYAHGNGKAENRNKKLTYIGKFSNGHRVKGKISYNNTPMYDGHLKNGKPNGVGICFHEGEPEECKFYEGKRVDSLFKQRIEMAKQTKLMDDKLAQMQAAQNKQLLQIQSRTNQRVNSAAKSKTMGDALMDKAMDKAIDKVFDSLF